MEKQGLACENSLRCDIQPDTKSKNCDDNIVYHYFILNQTVTNPSINETNPCDKRGKINTWVCHNWIWNEVIINMIIVAILALRFPIKLRFPANTPITQPDVPMELFILKEGR